MSDDKPSSSSSNNKEVFVDFSGVEEEVVEEIQTNEQAIADSPLDKLQASLPPVIAEAIDKLRSSYATHRKYYLIGLVAAIIVFVAIVALAILILWPNDGPDFNYSGTTESFIVGPFTLVPGENTKDLEDIPHPTTASSLRKIMISIIDKDNQTIPLEQVYSQLVYITNQNGRFIVGKGAEHQLSAPLNLPNPYVISITASDVWNLSFNLINLWGIAANANLDVYIKYDVTYSAISADDVQVHWAVVGTDFSNSTTQNSTPSSNHLTYHFTWDYPNSTIAVASGHLSIGGLNITLKDETNGVVIAECKSEYDPVNGYIVSIPPAYPFYVLSPGTDLSVTAVYDNDHVYNDVINAFQLWGTFPNDVGPFNNDNN